jgi:predicted AAA+ superfamily ATPase
MNYRNRHLESKILKFSKISPALLLTGARQTGKSTLLTHVLDPAIRHIVFDPVVDVGNARQDPEFFLSQNLPPIILDEIQYAPELLPVIKRRIDRDDRPGQYFLTGSQNLALLKNISESLAGRVIVLELGTMSLAERCGKAGEIIETWIDALFQDNAAALLKQRRRLPARTIERTLFDQIWRGGFPRLLDLSDDALPDMFASYISTYVERDIRILLHLEDQQLFSRFFALCAALTAQEINHSQLGREIGVTPQTAGRWIAMLKATYQWFEIPPFHGNVIKRISGRNKGYMSDTGLAAFLQRISSPQALAAHPLQGALFETHVVQDMLRQICLTSMPPRVYQWRSHGGAEVDLILERDGMFVPIEIKSKAHITAADARGIRAFRKTYPNIRQATGCIVASVDEVFELPDRVVVLPYDIQ